DLGVLQQTVRIEQVHQTISVDPVIRDRHQRDRHPAALGFDRLIHREAHDSVDLLHKEWLYAEADIDELNLFELHAVGGEKRHETLEGRAAFLGAKLDSFEQLARIGYRPVFRTDEHDWRALVVSRN